MLPRKSHEVMLSTKQHFWRTLFEENDLARHIPGCVSTNINGNQTNKFVISHFGEVVVKAKAASTLGDNFMSDTYIVEATQTKTDVKFTAFIKVKTTLNMANQLVVVVKRMIRTVQYGN